MTTTTNTQQLDVRHLGRLDYQAALDIQIATRDALIASRSAHELPHTLLLLEHDPVVTLGRRGERGGQRDGILAPDALRSAGIDVLTTNRGGNITYHGPGQLVAYPILDLRRLDRFGQQYGVHRYVDGLENTVLQVLRAYDIDAHRDPTERGIFTDRGKIASLGVHISRWVTMHGIALNVDPDMDHWACIAPCGRLDITATSIGAHKRANGAHPPTIDAVAAQFTQAFLAEFDLRTASP
jgi:lipoate-protein ligase B